MKIRTLNRNERVTRREFKFASEFILSLLVNKRTQKKLDITIESRDEVFGEDVLAQIFPDAISRYKYKVLIYSKMSRKQQLLCLAHEYVHLKQFIFGQLGETKDIDGIMYTRWNKKNINESKYTEHHDFPWEVEAYRKEYGLWRQYDNYIRDNKIQYR